MHLFSHIQCFNDYLFLNQLGFQKFQSNYSLQYSMYGFEKEVSQYEEKGLFTFYKEQEYQQELLKNLQSPLLLNSLPYAHQSKSNSTRSPKMHKKSYSHGSNLNLLSYNTNQLAEKNKKSEIRMKKALYSNSKQKQKENRYYEELKTSMNPQIPIKAKSKRLLQDLKSTPLSKLVNKQIVFHLNNNIQPYQDMVQKSKNKYDNCNKLQKRSGRCKNSYEMFNSVLKQGVPQKKTLFPQIQSFNCSPSKQSYSHNLKSNENSKLFENFKRKNNDIDKISLKVQVPFRLFNKDLHNYEKQHLSIEQKIKKIGILFAKKNIKTNKNENVYENKCDH